MRWAPARTSACRKGPNVSTARRTAVIINPAAATGRAGRDWPKLEAAVREAIGEFAVFPTSEEESATDLTRKALRNGYERIISVGGDGTHNAVVNGFFESGKPIRAEACLGIISKGTMADYCRTLGIPRGEEGVSVLVNGRCRPVDVGRVTLTRDDGARTTRYFTNLADFGIGGEVVKHEHDVGKPLGTAFRFLYGTFKAMSTYKNPVMRIEIDGEHIVGRVYDVIIAKGQYYGGGMHVAPAALLDNGLFDVYVVGDISYGQALLNLPKLYRGRLTDRSDKVRYFRAKQIDASSEAKVAIGMDGEHPGFLPATFEIMPRALRVIS